MHSIKNKTIKYQAIFIVISIVMAIRCVGKKLSISLTTSLALSYEYGIRDKSLVGTIYKTISSLFADDIYVYEMAFIYSAISMIVLVIVYVVIGNFLIRRTKKTKQDMVFIILMFFTIFAMSIYTAEDYIGSAESCMLTIMILNIVCIAMDSNIIILLLLPISGMIISSDYLFAYMGITIVLLAYSFIKKKKAKHMIVMIFNMLSTVLIYIYFAFKHSDVFETNIRDTATGMSINEEVKEGVLDFYFYGFLRAQDHFPELYICLLRVSITLVLSIPFIIFFVVLFKKTIELSKDCQERTFYRLIPFGGLFVAPLFFYSNNYGTWFFAIMAYYVMLVLGLVLMGDRYVQVAFYEVLNIKKNYKWLLALLMIYAVFFTPIDSVKIGQFVNNFILK